MPAEPSLNPTNNESRRWVWPTLIFAVAILSIGGMIYTQRLMQQVDTIEQNQVPQNASRQLLLKQADVLNINWMRTLNPLAKNIQGDIVWSTSMQQGIMRFANLPVLPSGQLYHLWIHDLTSPADEPVSVVTFTPDIKFPTELLIPFTTQRRINEPYKFMINIEHSDKGVTPEPLLLAQP